MKCRVCESNRLECVLELGEQPWCNNFLTKNQIGKEPFYPLNLLYCKSCNLSQLDYTVKKEIMFGDHTYLSGITTALSNHFKKVAYDVFRNNFSKNRYVNVLDIGSNDGTQLKHYKDLGCKILGVESSKYISKIANRNGIRTINKFFNEKVVGEINSKFDIINASGVFFHLEELDSVCKGIKKALKDNGIFVVQFLYMKNIIENLAFDQIYHEHLIYYTLETIQNLLSKYQLTMYDGYLSEIHGGSIIGYVSHNNRRKITQRLTELNNLENESGVNNLSTYKAFAKNVEKLKYENVEYLYGKKAANKKIYGFGAPVKGNTLLNYFNIDSDIIELLVEKNKLRKNLYSPGMHIPIALEDELKDYPDIYYVLAWNFKNEILKNNSKLIEKGIEFKFPINPKLSA